MFCHVSALVLAIALVRDVPLTYGKEPGITCLKRTLVSLLNNNQGPEEELISDQVSILWYPLKTRWPTHMKLQIGDEIFDARGGFSRKGSAEGAERLANGSNQGFWRFKLKVTEAELERIRKHIDERIGRPSSATCVSGSCGAITNNSAISIPVPFSKVPSLAALYLTITKRLGYSRIASVEFIGKNKVGSFVSLGLASEYAVPALGAAYAVVGYLIVRMLTPDGNNETAVVPLEIKPVSDRK